MKFDPLQVFMAILRYVPAIIAIVVTIIFIFSFKLVIVTNEMDRTNMEIAENFFSSELTYDRAVFDPAELTKLIDRANSIFYPNGNKKDDKPDIEPEWVARHCRIGYRAEIEDLTTKKTWAFGYVPDNSKSSELSLESRMVYDTAIYVTFPRGRGYGDVHPARLTLTLKETWLSRIGCMIEEAYEFKEPRTIEVPCIYESRTGASDPSGIARPGKALCLVEIKKSDANGKRICLHKPSYIYSGFNEIAECRYFPKNINLVDSSWLYDRDAATKKLTVYPVEENLGQLNDKELRDKCDSLDTKYKTTPLPEVKDVKSVIICIK